MFRYDDKVQRTQPAYFLYKKKTKSFYLDFLTFETIWKR